MARPSMRGRVALVGIGESRYYKHGASPDSEFRMLLDAVLAAAKDAGIDPREIDGFSSYGNDRNMPARIANALGTHRLTSATLQWGAGGGGCCAAVGNGAASIHSGMADCVVAFRGIAQGQHGRFGQGAGYASAAGEVGFEIPYGMVSPAQKLALRVRRFMHEHGVRQEAMRAIAMASYHHAQANPRALMHGKPLTEERYDQSRWIAEPFHLFDCCMENDGAAAVIMVSADKAGQLAHKPAYLLGCAGGSDHRGSASSHNAPRYATSNFTSVAARLYQMAELSPRDVGSVQSYENFTGGVLMALAEHGFFSPEEANDFLQLDNLIAPGGGLPLNTSGGNLAECYVHGFEQVLEAVRQIRGSSTAQARRSDVALVIGGPMVSIVSSLLLGSEATL